MSYDNPAVFILSQKTWSSLRAVSPTLRAGSWARSETIGSAENICHGMMEYWNDGMLGLVEWDLYFIRMARISF